MHNVFFNIVNFYLQLVVFFSFGQLTQIGLLFVKGKYSSAKSFVYTSTGCLI